MVLGRDATRDVVLDTELWSDGALHDVCYVPGGAMTHPDRRDLFRLQLDRPACLRAPRTEELRRLAGRLLSRHGLGWEDVALHLAPNLSREDRDELAAAFGGSASRPGDDNLAAHGHLQSNDFFLNWLSAVDGGGLRPGDHVLVSSHGFGFTAGVSLLRR
jgi:3-oxoacyl-[acyl-carrier-protein] synthase III